MLTAMRPRLKRKSAPKPPLSRPSTPAASFLEACFACLCPEATLRRLCRYRSSSVGAPPLLPVGELVLAVVFHAVLSAGTLAEHLHLLCGRRYAESSLAERRAALPWRVWTDLLRQALRRLADRGRHPDAFYRQWRLVAIDGTRFSLQNTPQNVRARSTTGASEWRGCFGRLSYWFFWSRRWKPGRCNPISSPQCCIARPVGWPWRRAPRKYFPRCFRPLWRQATRSPPTPVPRRAHQLRILYTISGSANNQTMSRPHSRPFNKL